MLPSNSIHIKNPTTYTLYVSKNNGDVGIINPKGDLLVKNCSGKAVEEVVLEFRAVKRVSLGCRRGEFPMGIHNELALVGTNVPGKSITLHSYDF